MNINGYDKNKLIDHYMQFN